MYKRETRFKGQKRVSVGRMTRHSDPSDSKSKDSSRENYEDPTRVVKFNDPSTNVTLSGVQVSGLFHRRLWRREVCHYRMQIAGMLVVRM